MAASALSHSVIATLMRGGPPSAWKTLLRPGLAIISKGRWPTYCAPHCSILLSQTDRPASRLLTIRAILLSDRGFGEPHEAGPGCGSRVQEMSRTAFVGDQMTHGGQKGFGMTKHGRSGHATRSPRFRFLQKLEAQKNDRKDSSRIKDPKQSVEELFHPRKPT
jgi:hypothetical protein